MVTARRRGPGRSSGAHQPGTRRRSCSMLVSSADSRTMTLMARLSLAEIALLTAACLVTATLADRILAMAGFAGERPPRIAHPPHFYEQRRSMEFVFEFRTNDHGLRYRDVPLAKPSQTRRVLLLGDSFTEGWGVPADQTFGALLEAALADQGPIEFVNGGLSGTGPVEYRRLLIHLGLAYQPDAVLLCLYANDVAGTPVETAGSEALRPPPARREGLSRMAHQIWPRLCTMVDQARDRFDRPGRRNWRNFIKRTSERARAIGVDQQSIDGWAARLPNDLVHATERGEFNGGILSTGLLRPDYWVEALDLQGRQGAERYAAMDSVLSSVVDQLRGRKIEVAALYIPVVFQYNPASFEPGTRNTWREGGAILRREWLTEEAPVQARLREWAASANVPWLDLTPGFREAAAKRADLNWPLDDHWNAQGHRLAARLIASWLRNGALSATRSERAAGTSRSPAAR